MNFDTFITNTNDFISNIVELNLTSELMFKILNSNFSTAIIGSFAGAYAGAVAATKFVQRNKLQDEIIKEIRNINAAITLTFSCFNSLIQLKKQHVSSLKSEYIKHKDLLNKFLERNSNNSAEQFHLFIDGKTLPKITLPIEHLRDIVFFQLNASSRPICLTSAIYESLDKLNNAIDKRNDLVHLFKQKIFPPGNDLVSMYFGEGYTDGQFNTEYPDSVFAIANYTDDLIFFCYLLCNDLEKYGNDLNKKTKHLTKTKFLIHQINFDEPLKEDLIPPILHYPTWYSAFNNL